MLARLGIVARGDANQRIGSGGRRQELLQVVQFLLKSELMLRCFWSVMVARSHGSEDTVELRLDCLKARVGFFGLLLGVVEMVGQHVFTEALTLLEDHEGFAKCILVHGLVRQSYP